MGEFGPPDPLCQPYFQTLATATPLDLTQGLITDSGQLSARLLQAYELSRTESFLYNTYEDSYRLHASSRTLRMQYI